MAIISKAKILLKVNTVLKNYLISSERGTNLPISYKDLCLFEDSIPLAEPNYDGIRWETLQYNPEQAKDLHTGLVNMYAYLKADGDVTAMEHLRIERLDQFIFGKTKPIRIKIVNPHNGNFDYFYIKIADASRIYGLEIEHFLSPHRMNYLVGKDTILEEHIHGIPGDTFILNHLTDKSLNTIQLAKEFVKFNERCWVRLLGDMHPGNFVVMATPDFEGVNYKIRSIDFDQQSYEGKKAIYSPQSFKRNSPFVGLVSDHLDQQSIKQYQKEERSLLAKRIRSSHSQIKKLTEAMARDVTSFPQNVDLLKAQLAEHYKAKEFLTCKNMGEIFVMSLKQLFPKKS
ncbi:MAG: hypothetical protein M3512_01650 [Bacteroidota bacterium]|nr:hypothetical protein [Bacteroidota bacterium]